METGPKYQGTRIAAPPTQAGQGGRGWRLTLPSPGSRALPDHEGTVGGFLVAAPGAHPFWDHYLFMVVHLRPIPGVKPAHKRFEAATHEFMIMALDPGQPLPTLIDVIEQFAAADDATADQRAWRDAIASTAQHFADGTHRVSKQ